MKKGYLFLLYFIAFCVYLYFEEKELFVILLIIVLVIVLGLVIYGIFRSLSYKRKCNKIDAVRFKYPNAYRCYVKSLGYDYPINLDNIDDAQIDKISSEKPEFWEMQEKAYLLIEKVYFIKEKYYYGYLRYFYRSSIDDLILMRNDVDDITLTKAKDIIEAKEEIIKLQIKEVNNLFKRKVLNSKEYPLRKIYVYAFVGESPIIENLNISQKEYVIENLEALDKYIKKMLRGRGDYV